MMKTSILLLPVIVLLVTSCGAAADETIGDSVEKGGYLIVIEGTEGGPCLLVGENVDTNWDAGSGFIFLNTDENNEPIGTLTFAIGEIEEGKAAILSAVVSKTEVKVGTA